MTPAAATTTASHTSLASRLRRCAKTPSPLLERLQVVAARRALGAHAEERPLARRLILRLERLERTRRSACGGRVSLARTRG